MIIITKITLLKKRCSNIIDNIDNIKLKTIMKIIFATLTTKNSIITNKI